MHRLPHSSSVLRFRFAAILLILQWLAIIVSIAILVYAITLDMRETALTAIGLSAAGLFLWLTHWVLSQRARCPLCLVPSFSHKRCARSIRVRPLLGSYPLRVAVSVVFRGFFRCPYCGETTALEARRPHRC